VQAGAISSVHRKAKVKRCVFSFPLKILSELASLMSIGSVFHSLGASLTKSASPVFFWLLLGTFNKPALDDHIVLEGT